MKKIALADVLWKAANEHLSYPGTGGLSFSCWAAESAAYTSRVYHGDVVGFLEDLGCDSHSAQFGNYQLGNHRQGVRYMWLLLAMHVAQDEGIMVEVQS